MDLWLRTNETEEAVSALEMLSEICPTLISDGYRWKWAIMAAHNALQGFMVLALRQGNGLLALKDEVTQKWLRAYREGGKYPVEKLDNFLNLYEKIKSDRMLCYVHSRNFIATDDHDRAVKMLNNLRNDFIHFIPKGWRLELTGLPEISLFCLDVVEFLGWKSGNLIFYEPHQRERAEKSLRKTKEILVEIKQLYEGAANRGD